jgi:flagellar biogenesis protein FliO
MKKWFYFLLFSLSLCTLQAKTGAVFLQEDGQLVAQENVLDEQPKELTDSPVSYSTGLSKILWMTIAFLTLLVITIWAFKRMVKNRAYLAEQRSSIKILEKKMLSPKTMLYLVEVEKEKVLIAESHIEVKRLHEMTTKTKEIQENEEV